MNSLHGAVLATLVYYDILDYPLTSFEIHKYLINPKRFTKSGVGVGNIELKEINTLLGEFVRSGVVGKKNRFYYLFRKDDICRLRVKREKISSQKWKKFLKLSKWLTTAPYLRGVFASGSMALGNTDNDSDFDVLVIAKKNRIYTCRFFLWLISSMLRARRGRYDKVAPDKFCFNHYISEDGLYLSHQSLFNAQTYIHLKPVFIDPFLTEKFYSANRWINNYVHKFKPLYYDAGRSVDSTLFLKNIARIFEFILKGIVGDVIENILKKYQQRRIRLNPATYEEGGRVVFNDKELEFHPRSFEKTLLARYNSGLMNLGVILDSEEEDSGLLK
jgi:hypothetical protein